MSLFDQIKFLHLVAMAAMLSATMVSGLLHALARKYRSGEAALLITLRTIGLMIAKL